jgi:hypothetical protein
MSVFWIFVIILTVTYVIYYTVDISSDLYLKPKEQSASSEETFEIKDMDEEAS